MWPRGRQACQVTQPGTSAPMDPGPLTLDPWGAECRGAEPSGPLGSFIPGPATSQLSDLGTLSLISPSAVSSSVNQNKTGGPHSVLQMAELMHGGCRPALGS